MRELGWVKGRGGEGQSGQAWTDTVPGLSSVLTRVSRFMMGADLMAMKGGGLQSSRHGAWFRVLPWPLCCS